MKITRSQIEKLNPCKDRLDNFKKHYPNFSGEFSDFLRLENITFSDKAWVASKVLSKNQLVRWSILCAESVKHIYESRYPDDRTLTMLFDYLNSISDFENLTDIQKTEIKTHWRAVDAAAYAANTAAYAANTAAYAPAAKEEQRDLNLLFLISLCEV